MCRRHGVGVVVWSPMAGGWLTGKYNRADTPPADSRAVTNADHFDAANAAKRAAVDALAKIAADAGVPLPHLALAWTWAHPAVTSALVGIRTLAQLDDAIGAGDVTLSDDVLDAIDAVVPPGTDLNPSDAGFTPPGLAVDARRR